MDPVAVTLFVVSSDVDPAVKESTVTDDREEVISLLVEPLAAVSTELAMLPSVLLSAKADSMSATVVLASDVESTTMMMSYSMTPPSMLVTITVAPSGKRLCA